jgi:hypothetical protein
MNLIEQQSAAKDLPMQYLQQAVNGQNPNLTPWIATAELQRRTTMNQHMKPQGPQGPQPTVKDQVEQKAGLMATQAAQQAQAAQAQQSSTPPGPVPGGIPQPEPQPEEPVMAARGGLMNAPVNFQFAHGGILGFADGGDTPNTNTPETYVDDQGIRRFTNTDQPVQAAQPVQAPQQARPQGLRAGVEQYSTSPTPPASMREAIANEQLRAKTYGLDQPMGAEERAIIAQRNAARDVARKREGDDAFSAYVSGLIGVPGEGGRQYSLARQGQDAAEREHLTGNLKDIKELNTAQRAALEKRSTAAESGFAADQLAAATARFNKAGIGERLVGTDAQTAAEKMRDLTSRYNNEQTNKTHVQVTALNRAMQGAQFNRQEARDAANQLNQMGQRAEADVNNLRAQYAAAKKNMDDPEAARVLPLLTNAEAIHKNVVAAIGKSTGVAVPTGPANSMSVTDQQALNWANSNPKDPRAAQIKQKLGM